MNPAPLPISPIEWYWWILVGGVMLVGVGIVLWALCWDRARGRKRCPKCWYDMAGQKAQRDEETEGRRAECWRCPECGSLINREKKLRKTRRRWRWGLAALIFLVIAPPSGLMVQASRIGLWQAMPDWALIRIVDWQEWPEPSLSFMRMGTALAPTRFRAQSASEELSRRLLWSGLSQGDLESIVRSELQSCVKSRRTWPKGVKFYFRIESPSWIQLLGDGDLYIRPVRDESRTVWGMALGSFPRDASWITGREVESIPPNNPRFQLEAIVVAEARYNGALASGEVLRVRIERCVSHVDSVDDILKPVPSSHITEWLKNRLRVHLIRIDQDPLESVWYVRIDRGMTSRQDIAIGVRFEVRRQDKVVGVARHLLNETGSEDVSPLARLEFIDESLDDTDFSDPAWSLHVIGDGEMALRDFDKDKYWAGEFSIPMSQVEIVRTQR